MQEGIMPPPLTPPLLCACMPFKMTRLPVTLPLQDVSFESAVMALSRYPGFVAIDSRSAGVSSRYSIVASEPAHSFSFSGAFITVDGHTVIDTPLTALAGFFDMISAWKSDPYLPFSGGIIGYIGFEGARALGGFAPARGFSRFPQCKMGIHKTAAIFDHAEDQAFVVSNSEDASEARRMADELIEKLSGRANFKMMSSQFCEGGYASPRVAPDNSDFDKILREAGLWLKAEKLDTIHLARRTIYPSSNLTPISSFLDGCVAGCIQAVFPHEEMNALAVSEAHANNIHDGSLYPSGISRARRLAAFAPWQSHCGSPTESAISFLDANEDIHRNLYGGFFGLLDSRRFAFRVISETREFSDGAVTFTRGANLRADTNPASFLAMT